MTVENAPSTGATTAPRGSVVSNTIRPDAVPLLTTYGANATKDCEQQIPSSKFPTLLRHPLIAKVVAPLIAAIVLIIIFVFWLVLSSEKPVCTTSKCVLTSSSILQKMDLSIDPCDDFYEFSCGKWINESVNLNYPAWNVLYETTIRVHDRLVDAMLRIANKDFVVDLNAGEQAAVELFRQCTDIETLKTIGLRTWRSFVEEIGGWIEESASYSIESRIEDSILLAYNYSVYPIFWSGVEVNYFNSTSHIITIYEQLPLLLVPRIYAHPTSVTAEMILNGEGSQATSILQEMGETMAELLNLDIKDDRIRRAIAEMVEFEWRITVAGSQFSKLPKDYEIMTLVELQRIAPAIDWRYFLSRLLNIEIGLHEQIAIKSGHHWLANLSRVLSEYLTSERGLYIVRNYIKFKALFFQLSYVKTDSKKGSLWTIVEHYSGPSHLRKEFCLVRVHGIFPLSLPSLLKKLVGHDNNDKNRELVRNIAENIRAEYQFVLEQSEIFDPFTRNTVLSKLRNMNVLVGHPEAVDNEIDVNAEASRVSTELFWSIVHGAASVYRSKLRRLRLPVNPNDWVDNKPAISSTPIHNFERNLIQIPMDTLQAPIADTKMLDVSTYAACGSIIGHEVAHAFDEQGHRHGPTGNLGLKDDQFWTRNSLGRYKEKEKCFIEQYVKLGGENVKEEDARKSLSENIADNVGTKVAFDAFVRHGDQSFSKLAALQLSPKQIFFVSYAQGWCALPSKNHQRQVHLAEKIRVLGTLQNSVDFANAFSCPIGSKMNPHKKCRTFYLQTRVGTTAIMTVRKCILILIMQLAFIVLVAAFPTSKDRYQFVISELMRRTRQFPFNAPFDPFVGRLQNFDEAAHYL